MRTSALTASIPLFLMASVFAQEAPTDADAAISEAAGGSATVTRLTRFGSDEFVTGSTLGPDGALYVTDGMAGEVLRISLPDGLVETYATGLPPKAFQGQDIGGPVDVAFLDGTAYVLVSLVSGAFEGEPFGDSESRNGVYQIEPGRAPSLIADLGQWSIDNPSQSAVLVNTGVFFGLEVHAGRFLVTDAHHNRVLQVDLDGTITEIATFGNDVPVGLETRADTFLVAQMGPIPHLPEDGKIVAGGEMNVIASGAAMLIDVEQGPQDKLYALSQGEWDGVGEGSRALQDTGRLFVVGSEGDLTPVMGEDGRPLVLDRPTSIEVVGDTAYVVSVTGDVYRIDGL